MRNGSYAVRRILVLMVTLVGGSAFAHTRAPARSDRARDDAQTMYFRTQLRSLGGCFALAGGGGPRSKGNLSVEVQPPGDVSDVIVEGPLPASVVTCVAGR